MKNIFKKKDMTKYNLEQFMKLTLINDLYKDNVVKMYEEILKIIDSDNTYKNMNKKESDLLIEDFMKTLGEKPDFVQRFTMDGIEYGFIPNLDDMTVGEYLDLESYINGGMEQAHKVMSILYRPVIKSAGKLYRIEPYEGTSKFCDKMLKSDYSIYLSSLVFFYHLRMSLLSYIDTYSIAMTPKKKMKKV